MHGRKIDEQCIAIQLALMVFEKVMLKDANFYVIYAKLCKLHLHKSCKFGNVLFNFQLSIM